MLFSLSAAGTACGPSNRCGGFGARLRLTQLEDQTNPSPVTELPPVLAPPAGLADVPAVAAPASRGRGAFAAAGLTRAAARYEIKFLENMIDHHAMAVMMAGLCQEKAVHEDLRALCGEIEQAQTAEIGQMQAWLEEWYGITHEPRMTKQMDRQVEKLAALSGPGFEVGFMRMMIGHHETAVREGERCVDRAYHPGLVQLCQNIVATQTQEMQTMRTWLGDWYGVEPHGPNAGKPGGG